MKTTARFVPICVVGLLVIMTLYSLGLKIYLNSASFSWNPNIATIETIAFEDKSVDLTYRYDVEEIEYIGNKISFLNSGTIEDRDYVRKNMKIGQEITVYIDPSSHKRSVVLRKSLSFDHVKLSILILVFGLGGLYFLWKNPDLLRLKTKNEIEN